MSKTEQTKSSETIDFRGFRADLLYLCVFHEDIKIMQLVGVEPMGNAVIMSPAGQNYKFNCKPLF